MTAWVLALRVAAAVAEISLRLLQAHPILLVKWPLSAPINLLYQQTVLNRIMLQ